MLSLELLKCFPSTEMRVFSPILETGPVIQSIPSAHYQMADNNAKLEWA